MRDRDVDICVLESQAEADALTDLLVDHDIEALVISNHDTAFGGLWQTQGGWGRLRVRFEDAEQAAVLVRAWRRAEPEEEPRRHHRDQDRARDRERRREWREDRELRQERRDPRRRAHRASPR